MKKISLILFVIISTFSFAQKKEKLKIKVDRKTDVVMVNGEPFFKYVNKTGGGLEFFNINGESFLYKVQTCYQDYKAVSDSNPKGNVCYSTLYFEGVEEKTEIKGYGLKGIAKLLIEHNIYVDGILNIEEVKKFIKRNGNRHSAEQFK